eukprot:jgi/Mesvir1/12953/Mv05966-RA.1
MSDNENDEEQQELDLSIPDVVTKYKVAADITNRALQYVLENCKPGVKIADVCEKGDEFIRQQTATVFTKSGKGKVEKGIAFPTCVSPNSCICHFSPTAEDTTVLNDGDIIKIDMGTQIDGFIAVVAHTHVVQEMAAPVTGRAADVIAAGLYAQEIALRLVRPGKKNSEVTEALAKVAKAFDVHVAEGVLSHQMKRFVIDGNKVVLNQPTTDARVDDFEFEENEVYAVDLVFTTGEGKPKMLDEKQTTVYKRDVAVNYSLKMKASRVTFSEIQTKFPIMPFSTRALEDKRARLGLVECVAHGLLTPYPVLFEKPGEVTAHFKFTVLLMPNGQDKVTGLAAPVQEVQSSKVVEDADLKAILATSLKSKKKGGGARKKLKGKRGQRKGDHGC